MIYVLGIDDHDSQIGGCTTHFSTLLIKYLIEKEGISLVDFPSLVRLNPNIPWKTRGNGSVKIVFKSSRDIHDLLDIIWDKSIEYTTEISKADKFNRKPGVALTQFNTSILEGINWVYKKALTDVIPIDLAKKIAEKYNILIRGDRGVIGSIAALGFNSDKFTYELLTYRNIDEERKVNEESVIAFEEKYFPKVFANYDFIKRKALISPHGNDPVLYGVRGLDPYILLNALKEIKTENKIENSMIFKSNQATDSHIVVSGTLYQTAITRVKVKEVKILKGGDVIVTGENGDHIIFYKETGELNLAAQQLINGDEIEVIGAIKPSIQYGKIIEAERFTIISLSTFKSMNPKCPMCGGSSESLGKGKGFRCKKCNYIFFGNKANVEIERGLLKSTYQSRVYRHLTKPIFLEVSPVIINDVNEINRLVRHLLKIN